MSSDMDRERAMANRDAVIAFLGEKLGCGFDSRDESELRDGLGIRFFAPGRKDFGQLHIRPEPLEDTESPEVLVQFLRDELVPSFLQEGKFVSVKYDNQDNLDLDVT